MNAPAQDDRSARLRYRFGRFEFDPETGELFRVADPGLAGPAEVPAPAEVAARLAPQPARLLAALAAARGEVVTRETIKRTIWPDVEVDFDTSLHFCIRQVRAALGDGASQPSYVETLPRRGYRLIQPVEVVGPQEAVSPGVSRPPEVWPRRIAAALLLLFAAGAAFVALRVGNDAAEAAPATPPTVPSVGIMPFAAPPDWDGNEIEARLIAEGVLLRLGQQGAERLRVVGPSSSATFEGDRGVRDLAEAFGLDYVVNGRFLLGDRGPGVLAELIRTSDGAHVWVRRYERIDDGDRIAAEIAEAILPRLAAD